MKALIYILAIVLMALGVAVALMSRFSPGDVVLGFNLDLAGTLLAGGVITLGLAGVMAAIEGLRRQMNRLARALPGEAGGIVHTEPPAMSGEAPAEVAAVAVGTAVATSVATAEADLAAEDADRDAEEEDEAPAAESSRQIFVSPRPHETEEVAAAADDDETAPDEAVAETPEADAEADEDLADEAAAEAEEAAEALAGDELYVVEERTIRGRPARMLSDGTVEAETDEGWMRFENLEHLEEYMEAMTPAR